MESVEPRQQISASHWDILQKAPMDASTQEMQYREFLPDVSNYSDNISTYTIRVTDSVNDWCLLSHAYIQVQGELKKADGTDYAPTDNSALVNSGYSLFDRAQLLAGGSLIEEVDHCPQAMQVKLLVESSDDYKRSTGSNLGFFPDSTDAAVGISTLYTPAAAAVGNFTAVVKAHGDNVGGLGGNTIVGDGPVTVLTSNARFEQQNARNIGFAERQALNVGRLTSFMLPLRHLFGFASVDKVSRGIDLQVRLTRAEMNDVIHRAPAAAAGKFSFKKLSLWVPLLKPSLAVAAQLETQLAVGQMIHYDYLNWTCYKSEAAMTAQRTWRITTQSERPLYVFAMPQATVRDGNQERSPVVFDNAGVREMSLRVNGKQYPSESFSCDFTTAGAEDHSRVYMSLMSYMNKAWNFSDGGIVNYASFASLYPIFTFDLTALDENVYSNPIELQLRATVGDVAQNIHFYAVVVSEKSVVLQADSNRAVVIQK
jgi:hypothetical protein